LHVLLSHTLSFSLFFVLLQHTHFFLLYLSSHTYTHSFFLFFALLVLPHAHIISLFSCCHTRTSLPSFTNIKRKKSQKKNLFGMHEETIV
jgi:hypothetical protein